MVIVDALLKKVESKYDRRFDFKEGEVLKFLTAQIDGEEVSFVRVYKPLLVIEKNLTAEGEEKLSETILANANLHTDQVRLNLGADRTEMAFLVYKEIKVDGAFSVTIKGGEFFSCFLLEETKLSSTNAKILKDGSLWIALGI